jgi:hypothetical protein
MSFGPSGLNTLFYNSRERIKSGMPYHTWSGGQPGSTAPQQTSSNACFAQAQIAATISAVGASPLVAKERYTSSLDQLQKHCQHK